MPGIAHFYRSLGLDTDGKPLAKPESESAPEPPAAPGPEPRLGLSATARMQIALLQDVIRKAIAQPVGQAESQEDPTIRRNREILSGEVKPENLSELARAARWALEHRDEIEI